LQIFICGISLCDFQRTRDRFRSSLQRLSRPCRRFVMVPADGWDVKGCEGNLDKWASAGSADIHFSRFPLDLSLERLRCAAPFQHLPMILSHAAHVVELCRRSRRLVQGGTEGRHSADIHFSRFPLDLSLERLRCAAPFQHLPMILSHAAHVVECAVGRVAWSRVALECGTRRTPASRVSPLICRWNGFAALRRSSTFP
jgi:hypothetical protein